jgi:hypothetical protein
MRAAPRIKACVDVGGHWHCTAWETVSFGIQGLQGIMNRMKVLQIYELGSDTQTDS